MEPTLLKLWMIKIIEQNSVPQASEERLLIQPDRCLVGEKYRKDPQQNFIP